MRRGTRPVKAKGSAKRPVARKSSKRGAPEDRQLEQRLAESLEQQTATGEILRVISGSPTDVRPVFEIIGESAARLCEAEWSAAVTRFDGEWVHLEAAIHGSSAAGVEALRQTFPMPPTGSGERPAPFATGRSCTSRTSWATRSTGIQATRGDGGLSRALLGVPMLREGRAIGAITLGRARAGAFSDPQVPLLHDLRRPGRDRHRERPPLPRAGRRATAP